MIKRKNKPTWIVLYALVILMIVAFVLEGRDGLPVWANEFVGFGIVLFVFGGMLLWVRANASALWEEDLKDLDKDELKIDVYEPLSPPVQSPNDNGHSDSKFEFAMNNINWFVEKGK